MTDAPSPRCSSGSAEPWREIDSATPRANDHFLILWCREDDSYWWASWQGGMWFGCDELGLRRTSESFTPDFWCEIPRITGVAQAAPEGWKLVPTIPNQAMIEAGCDNNPTSWNEGTDDGFAADVVNDVYVAMVRAAPSSVSSTNSYSAATKHSGTFLGYRDEHGNEMHCAHAFCPHQAKCRKGCINPVAVTSTDRS